MPPEFKNKKKTNGKIRNQNKNEFIFQEYLRG
jgi:hypothetical protein